MEIRTYATLKALCFLPGALSVSFWTLSLYIFESCARVTAVVVEIVCKVCSMLVYLMENG